MAAKCIAQHVGKNCFVGRLNVGLHSNGPLSNGTLVHLLKVVHDLLEGNYGQALGLESEVRDDGLISNVNSESTESDGPGQDAPTAGSGSKHLSGGIKAVITLLCLVVAGLVAVLATCHFRQPVTKEVTDEEEEESEIHDTMAVTTDQNDEIYGA
jgi:hypothetical protein